MGRQGKRLSGTARKIVNSVCEFMALEKRAGRSILRMNVVERVAKACQLSTSTVIGIRNKNKHGDVFKTPTKRYTTSRTQINVDDFDREAIRRVIHGIYERHEYPTLQSLLVELQSRQLFQGGKSTLHKLLLEMGFRYRKHENRRYIYEQPYIIQQRHDYLRAMRANRQSEQPRPVIFLDETWCNARHGRSHMWVDAEGRGGFKHSLGKGPRLIILHAGAVAGWVPKAEDIFVAKAKSGDFHNEMNASHFLEWFKYRLCTNIPVGSLIVLDNASYHNTQLDKAPTKSSTKQEMREWLTRHEIVYEESDLKADLLKRIRDSRPEKQYVTDVIVEPFTHKVLRLPVAHPELNPIELAWSVLKGYVAKRNKKFTLKEVKTLVPQAIKATTSTMWNNFCKHTEKIEEDYWKRDGLVEDIVEEMLITVGDESDDETSDEELEPDDDDLKYLSTVAEPERQEKQQSCRSLQFENIQITEDFLKSVLPLNQLPD